MKRKIIFSFYIVQIFNFFSQTASCNLILRQKSISKKKKNNPLFMYEQCKAQHLYMSTNIYYFVRRF